MCQVGVVVTDEVLPEGRPWVWLDEGSRLTWFVHRAALLADPEGVLAGYGPAAGAMIAAHWQRRAPTTRQTQKSAPPLDGGGAQRSATGE